MKLRTDLLEHLTAEDILEGGGGDSSPLQTRAAFIKNWDWQSVVRINRGACERGSAQHGPTSEGYATAARERQDREVTSHTLAETIDPHDP